MLGGIAVPRMLAVSNEATLRQRWDDVFHDSPEYRNAQKQASIRHAILKSQLENERQSLLRNRASAQDMMSFMQKSSQLLAESDPTLNGMDAYQRQRVSDYITRQRQQGQREFDALQQSPIASVSNGPDYMRQLQEPDFSTQQPWLVVRNAMVYPNAEQRAEATRLMDQHRATQAAAQQAQVADRAHAYQDAKNKAYDDQVDMIRREQGFLPILPPDIQATYSRMTPRERASVIRSSPETAYGMLAGSKLRPIGPLSGPGGGVITPGGQKDFLSMRPSMQVPGFTAYASQQGAPRAISNGVVGRPRPSAQLMGPNTRPQSSWRDALDTRGDQTGGGFETWGN